MGLRRDRTIVILGLVAVSALAWMYVLYLTANTTSMGISGNAGKDINSIGMSMPNQHAWQSGDFVLTFLMWAVMMVAMMTPSASPMILMFARLNRQRHIAKTPIPVTIIFFLGYLLVWIVFSAGATAAQWGLHSAALLSPDMISATPLLGGILLVFSGVYQFTPLKRACLAHCRTPLGFLMSEWREGTKGAFSMGMRHGIYCVGCCWLMMALLFVAAVMNLLWVALIAACILVEKIVPLGQWVSRAIGLLTIGWGAWLFIALLVK